MKLMEDALRLSRVISARPRAHQLYPAAILWQRTLRLGVRSNSRAPWRSATSLNKLQFARDVDRRSRHKQNVNNTKRQDTYLSETGATAA